MGATTILISDMVMIIIAQTIYYTSKNKRQ